MREAGRQGQGRESRTSVLGDRFLLGLTLVSVLLALFLYTGFLPRSRFLWESMIHDRNAHYYTAQTVAIDIQNADILHLGRDIERMRIWGPLHPILTGVAMAVVGVDFRVAVLVSLAAWVATALLAFLTARRLVKEQGDLAGLTAAFFVLASPAYRAFALDIMLESLGSCLSVAVIYTYIRCRQEPSTRHDRWFALSLTALFFLKYNYWILLLAGLFLAEGLRHARPLWRLIQRVPLLGTARTILAQLFQPLNYPWFLCGALMFLFRLLGPYEIPLPGKRVEIRSLDLIATLFCWSVLLRISPWWISTGSKVVKLRLPRLSTIVSFHLLPVVVWFLIPQRAGLFLSYLTRDHGAGESGTAVAERLGAYANAFALHYHGSWVLCFLAAGLVLVAVTQCRRLTPGAGLLLATMAVALLLTAMQPCCRSRFLHSWMAIVWVASGVGAAQAAALLSRVSLPKLAPIYPLAAAAGLLGVAGPAFWQLGQAPESGLKEDRQSVLDLADSYLEDLGAPGKIAILSNQPIKFFAKWTWQQKNRQTEKVESEALDFASQPGALDQWLDKVRCESVVWIDVGASSPFTIAEFASKNESLAQFSSGKTSLRENDRRNLAELGCSVTRWQRGKEPPAVVVTRGP